MGLKLLLMMKTDENESNDVSRFDVIGYHQDLMDNDNEYFWCRSTTTSSRTTTNFDDLDSNTLTVVLSFLSRRQDWTNVSAVNRRMYREYQRGVGMLLPPPWPCSVMSASSSSSSSCCCSVVQDDDRSKGYHGKNRPPLQFCSSSRDGTYLAGSDKKGNLKLWHRCLGLVGSWNVVSQENYYNSSDEGCRCSDNNNYNSNLLSMVGDEVSLRYLAMMKKKRDQDGDSETMLLLTMDTKGILKAWNVRLHIQPSNEVLSGITYRLEVKVLMKSKRWNPRMSLTANDDPVLIERPDFTGGHHHSIHHHNSPVSVVTRSLSFSSSSSNLPSSFPITNKRHPVIGTYASLVMDWSTQYLPIYVEVSSDKQCLLKCAPHQVTSNTVSIQYTLQRSGDSVEYTVGTGLMHPFVSTEWWMKTIDTLADNLEYRRATLCPDGSFVAFLELGPPKKLVFQNVEGCCQSGDSRHVVEETTSRSILLSGPSRFVPGTMSFLQDNNNDKNYKYLLIQFRYTARSGRCLNSFFCRNLIVNIRGGYCLTSLFHSKSSDDVGHYQLAESLRDETTRVNFFVPSICSVVTTGFVNGTTTTVTAGKDKAPVLSTTTKSSSSQVPGLSIAPIDFERLEEERKNLMNIQTKDLTTGIDQVLKINRARLLPSSLLTDHNQIVDWIIQFHDQHLIRNLLRWHRQYKFHEMS